MTNQIYGRFQQKHDTEANWLKATNFAPLEGELIVYDADENHDYPRFKVGIWDGTSEKTDEMLVSNLPFASAEQLLELGLGENSIQLTKANSEALGESSVSIGKGTIAGCKCYFIQGIDFTNKKIYIGDAKQTDFSVLPTLDTNYIAPAYTIGKEFSIIAKDAGAQYRQHYHFCGTIAAIENNVITYEGDLPIGGFGEDTYDYSPVFFVPSEPNIGVEIFTMGQTALGEDTIAAGENSLAAGYGSIAAGNYSTALGRSTKAAYGALAAGVTTSATGQRSTALGWNTIASGDTSTAEGTGTKAIGSNAHSEGQATQAIGNTAHAEGYSTIANGNQSHAEGGYTQAKGVNSHAEGYKTIAGSSNQHVEGKYNIEDTEGIYAVIVGNGEQNIRSNAYTLDWEGNATFAGNITANGKTVASIEDIENTKEEIDKNIEDTATNIRNEMVGVKVAGTTKGEKFNAASTAGNYAHAEGFSTQATGQYSHAEGGSTIASGAGAHAEGVGAKAEKYASHAEGSGTASGNYAHAEGLNTKAINEADHAEGSGTTASGWCSHAEGEGSVASSGTTHAEGKGTKVSGYSSHGEGYEVEVTGMYSHGEGYRTKAAHDHTHVEGINSQSTGAGGHAEGNNTRAGYFAHSEGINTIASGSFSHAGGEGTHATAQGQTAIGRFNKEDADALLIVGNGSGNDEELRSNAFVVKKNGTGYLGDKKIVTEGGALVATYWNSQSASLQLNGVYLIRTGYNDNMYCYITESELYFAGSGMQHQCTFSNGCSFYSSLDDNTHIYYTIAPQSSIPDDNGLLRTYFIEVIRII